MLVLFLLMFFRVPWPQPEPPPSAVYGRPCPSEPWRCESYGHLGADPSVFDPGDTGEGRRSRTGSHRR